MPKALDWLHDATKNLEQADSTTARLDCLVLLEDVTSKDRGWLLAHPEFELSDTHVTKLNGWLQRRSMHEPLAYIRKKTEFYGREFYINSQVLEPRPESETMISLLKTINLPQNALVADIGTGSGALAITAKLEIPTILAVAIDIDPKCLIVARRNARKLGAKISFLRGDLLTPLVTHNTIKRPTVLLCNLPYVPDDFHINPAAMREPRLAIFGGIGGLDVYRRLFAQLSDLTHKPRNILTESLPPQHQTLAEIAKAAGYQLETTDDFIQLFSYIG